MKVVSLLDNLSADDRLTAEHGLSLYIETEKHRILFDTGQTDAFARNAALLGVDLGLVDTAVLSHGHYVFSSSTTTLPSTCIAGHSKDSGRRTAEK